MTFRNKNRLEKLEARNPSEGIKPKQLCEFYGEPPKDPPDYGLPWGEAKPEERPSVSHGGKMSYYPPFKKRT